MAGVDKVTATRMFQELGIEALPALVFEPGARPSEQRLAGEFGSAQPLMLRTAARGEERNLPRVAGLPSGAAAEWIAQLDHRLAVIVQPYDDVVFSVEMTYEPPGLVVAEVVAGIWELDSTAVPVRVRVEPGGRPVVSGPAEAQPARFFGISDGYSTRLAEVQGWQVAMTVRWVEVHRCALAEIRSRVGTEFALKLHYAPSFGLSPQNVRRTGPLGTWVTDPAPAGAFQISSVDDDVPLSTDAVVVDLAVTREDSATVTAFALKLARVGVRAAWVRSGLLSHLAICLRAAGIEVHQTEEGSTACSA